MNDDEFHVDMFGAPLSPGDKVLYCLLRPGWSSARVSIETVYGFFGRRITLKQTRKSGNHRFTTTSKALIRYNQEDRGEQ
jgi:hypothetical protein